MTGSWLISLLISLLLPLFFGYVTLLLLLRGRTTNAPLTFALSYGLGLGILSQWILILAILEIPFSLQVIIIPLSVLFIPLYLIHTKLNGASNRSNKEPLFPDVIQSLSSRSKQGKSFIYLTVSYIFLSLLFIFWCSLNTPIQNWDAIATSAFKAKIFFYDRSVHHLNLPHASYPLHVPFIESWIALNLGQWDDFLVKIIFPLAFTAYLIIHYYFLRSLTDNKWALGGVCLLISSNFAVFHSTIAYREIFMMYYNCTAVMLLILWNKERTDVLLYLASLYAGFMTFVKLEGIGYLFIDTMVITYMLWETKNLQLKEKAGKLIRFMIPSFGIFFIFYSYKISMHISPMHNRLDLLLTTRQLLRIPEVFRNFIENLFLSGNWNIIWFMLLISVIANPNRIKTQSHVRILLLFLIMFFAVYLIIPVVTSTLIDHPTLLARILLHFFPLSTLLIILLNYQSKTESRSKNFLDHLP